MKRVAISVGDVNGIGLELLLRNHKQVSTLCHPIYCVDKTLLKQAADLLKLSLPENIEVAELNSSCVIIPGTITAQSGQVSFDSFKKAIELAQRKEVDAICTLPIHKKAWEKAGLSYKGHTDYLREHFKRDAIMMLGCQELFVALFTEHIPLREVVASLSTEKLTQFLIDLHRATAFEPIGVLGLNPHAGDDGVLGDEESMVIAAIDTANKYFDKTIFQGPIVPDVAFTPHARKATNRLVALYHDQGLAPLKALFFDQSINVSLNLPIIRTSVDHGTAFDIAYKSAHLNALSYLEAIKTAVSTQFHLVS